MNYTNKSFEELDVLDNFLMNAIATDKEVGEAFCRKVSPCYKGWQRKFEMLQYLQRSTADNAMDDLIKNSMTMSAG